jgi:cytosine/adenosine deaminase-related metal-dependent hydrolase
MNKDQLIIKDLRAVVTCDGADHMFENCDILIEEGVIAQIGRDLPVPENCEVLSGAHMLCYPGLVNTHHHLYQCFSRNLPHVQNMELFDWLRALYEVWKNLDGETVRYSSLAALGELAKNGCTTCFDHHYVFPRAAGDLLIDEQFGAAAEIGVRMVASRGSMDLSKKDGGLPPDTVVQTIGEIIADSERLIEAYHDPSFGSMRQIALAPCSPFSVSGELMKESALLARAKGVRLHTHLAETRDEVDYTLSRFGMRPLDYMESLGWMGPDVWYAHGIHFTDGEIARLAASGTGVAHCPISNMKLSSGVARIPDLLKVGVKVGLAVDGSASNDGSNMLEEIRVGYLLHRLTWGNRAPSGYDMLKLATVGSAGLLGRSDIGSLEIGKCADLFLIDSRRLELVGACLDPKSVLATVGVKGGADFTIVGGKVVVRGGRLANTDEDALAAKANKAMEKYIAKA